MGRPSDSDEPAIDDPTGPPGNERKRYGVSGVRVMAVSERVQDFGPDGKLITESRELYSATWRNGLAGR